MSPLLRDVLLSEARFRIVDCPSPPDAAIVDMAWVLREAFQRVDLASVEAAAARALADPFSEFVWQWELFPLLKAVLHQAYNCYRWR